MDGENKERAGCQQDRDHTKTGRGNKVDGKTAYGFSFRSAIGIYRQAGTHSEESDELADDFLGNLCREWEREALNIAPVTRVVLLRTGIVLSTREEC
jgi:NAD dependent epimerase/dehydratase family enzyme